ncbi:MAG: macrocin O-methyltransferase [Spirochaetales bacterium]|uniref:Macrocin O-methyltransferase n=1 Tax=Candidatus Thalassospirochaeta sargassi TaxID=3119039 RepID=A0AAJ1ILG1_9SPIO|nr:macrocin O-methyltransferase [Spirochaetales bacterium]
MTEREAAEFLGEKGYGIIPPSQYLIDMEEPFRKIWAAVSPFTMTSVERGYALYKAVEYIVRSRIPGDFVECGVWKGGSCMLMAMTLLQMGDAGRTIHLYDTYAGMTEPGGNDFIAWNGRSVAEKWNRDKAGLSDNFTDWAVSLENVRENILTTGYPASNLVFIEGPVEQTLEQNIPEQISLLRLDTDWYDSTRIELELLYPLLTKGGALLIDDYGHFTGARKAVDEYFGESSSVLLNRIDYTGRISIKTEIPE